MHHNNRGQMPRTRQEGDKKGVRAANSGLVRAEFGDELIRGGRTRICVMGQTGPQQVLS